MGLETWGRAAFLPEDYEGRHMDLEAVFGITGDAELDPWGGDWAAQKLAYGRQIALQVADQVVPQMATMFGSHLRTPEAGVSAKHSLKSRCTTEDVDFNVMDVRLQIGGVFRLTGDRELEPGDLILAARDAIAMDVANLAVFALEQRFEGKQRNHSKTRIRRENGQIVEFDRQNLPPPPDGGPTAAA